MLMLVQGHRLFRDLVIFSPKLSGFTSSLLRRGALQPIGALPAPSQEIISACQTTRDVAMSRSDCLIALFGRPVWLRCKLCQRVNPATTEESFRACWMEERAAMEQHHVSPADLWWFQTVCEHCQRPGKESNSLR
jgi:hypothetical protein